jgi:hypothetical protein
MGFFLYLYPGGLYYWLQDFSRNRILKFNYDFFSVKASTNCQRTRFGYKLICSLFVTTHYVRAYKTIHMYYLKKSHNSLNLCLDSLFKSDFTDFYA